MRVILLTRPDCPECDEVRTALRRMAAERDLQVQEVSVGGDAPRDPERDALLPIVEVQDVRIGRLVNPIAAGELEAYFDMARAVLKSNRAHAQAYVPRESPINRAVGFIGVHWLWLAALGLGAFVLLPWLAPIFAALGWWSVADPIYTAYAFQCHQLPERAAHIFGYEVAQCWRCNALYGGMFLFTVAFAVARDHDIPALGWLRKPIAPWVFALLMLPILVDGISHMLGVREPAAYGPEPTFGSFMVGSQVFSLDWTLRIITGLVAGLAAVWFAFPRMQRSVDESEALRLAPVTGDRGSGVGGR